MVFFDVQIDYSVRKADESVLRAFSSSLLMDDSVITHSIVDRNAIGMSKTALSFCTVSECRQHHHQGFHEIYPVSYTHLTLPTNREV